MCLNSCMFEQKVLNIVRILNPIKELFTIYNAVIVFINFAERMIGELLNRKPAWLNYSYNFTKTNNWLHNKNAEFFSIDWTTVIDIKCAEQGIEFVIKVSLTEDCESNQSLSNINLVPFLKHIENWNGIIE